MSSVRLCLPRNGSELGALGFWASGCLWLASPPVRGASWGKIDFQNERNCLHLFTCSFQSFLGKMDGFIGTLEQSMCVWCVWVCGCVVCVVCVVCGVCVFQESCSPPLYMEWMFPSLFFAIIYILKSPNVFQLKRRLYSFAASFFSTVDFKTNEWVRICTWDGTSWKNKRASGFVHPNNEFVGWPRKEQIGEC